MSARTNLQEFLRRKARPARGPQVNWDERRELWLKDIDSLYGKIKTWLKPSVVEGTVSFLVRPTSITEEYVGTYEVNNLHILVGKQKISFYPKGTLVFGAQGRVDVVGQKRTRTLIVNKQKWYTVTTPHAAHVKVEFSPFTGESFRRLMEEVME